MNLVTLQNDLVILRPLQISDYEALYQVAKDPLIWEQHQSFDRYKPDVFKLFFEDSIQSKGALIIIDKATNQIIGSSRFQPIPNVTTAIEIGWTFLNRQYWGGLYNKSFKSLMMEYAFQYYETIVYYIHKDNFRSQKATMKLGGQLIEKSNLSIFPQDKEELTFIITKMNK